MLDLSCPPRPHTHYFLDESTGSEYIIPESFVQKVKDELISLYRRIPTEDPNVLEDPSD